MLTKYNIDVYRVLYSAKLAKLFYLTFQVACFFIVTLFMDNVLGCFKSAPPKRPKVFTLKQKFLKAIPDKINERQLNYINDHCKFVLLSANDRHQSGEVYCNAGKRKGDLEYGDIRQKFRLCTVLTEWDGTAYMGNAHDSSHFVIYFPNFLTNVQFYYPTYCFNN